MEMVGIQFNSLLLYVHRDRTDGPSGTGGAQDGYLDFHTGLELWDGGADGKSIYAGTRTPCSDAGDAQFTNQGYLHAYGFQFAKQN